MLMAGVDVLLVAQMAGTGAITERGYGHSRNLSYSKPNPGSTERGLHEGFDLGCFERTNYLTVHRGSSFGQLQPSQFVNLASRLFFA
jgi:hypothetical protein